MFDQSLLGSARARPAIALGYVFEVLAVGVLVLIPLVRTEALMDALRLTRINLLAPSQGPAAQTTQPAKTGKRLKPTTQEFVVPTTIPRSLSEVLEEPAPREGPDIGLGFSPDMLVGIPGGGQVGILSGIPGYSTVPPPPVSVKPSTQKTIRVGGQAMDAKLIFQPKPEYSSLAKLMRVQGVVRLEGVISRDGTVENLKVLSGHPLLVRAAMEAVSRWRYQPTLLNGDPGEVITGIEVTFALTE